MSAQTSTSTDLYVHTQGAGHDVLLLGGFGDTVESWQAQIDDFADGFHVIAPDNRGAGRSPDIPEGHTIDHMADDAAAVLRAHATGPAHVAGFSGGGMVAQRLAARYPDLVDRLVLNGTFARFDAYARRMIQGWLVLAEHARSPVHFMEMFSYFILTPRAHEIGFADQWIKDGGEFPYQPTLEGLRRYLAALTAADNRELNARIQAPTLVLHGTADITDPVENGRALAEGIPGAELVLLDGEAHQPFQEIPERWNAIVRAFLSRSS